MLTGLRESLALFVQWVEGMDPKTQTTWIAVQAARRAVCDALRAGDTAGALGLLAAEELAVARWHAALAEDWFSGVPDEAPRG